MCEVSVRRLSSFLRFRQAARRSTPSILSLTRHSVGSTKEANRAYISFCMMLYQNLPINDYLRDMLFCLRPCL
jgi:hypothetical protein